MRVLPVLETGERVIVALSGGADSVALLLALAERGDWQLTAAHLNHMIRGEDAERDERFVRALCKRIGVKLICAREDVPALAAERQEGLETAARAARRAFLLRTMEADRATAIATAHHLGDQAETVVMHLGRGGGVHGAAGMRARVGMWAKPLLEVSRREILDFLAARRQDFCEDATNAACDTARNAVRHRVLPALEAVYPGAATALSRFAAIAADEDDYMIREAHALIMRGVQPLPFGSRLFVQDAHPAILRRVLWRLSGADFEGVERLMALYGQARGALSLTGFTAERAGEWLYFIRPDARPPAAAALADGARLPGIGHLSMRPAEPVPVRDDPLSQVLDAAALTGAVLRTRRPGDRMRMLGAPGGRLLSDVMIDRKIDRPLRDWMAVVARGNEVLWLPGAAIAQGVAISKDTEGACRLTWTREDLNDGNAPLDR